MSRSLLEVNRLTIDFTTRNGEVRAIDKVSFDVRKGEMLGVVGESGSGKSVTSYAVLGILDRAGKIANGRIVYGGMELQKAPERDMMDVRGREISMIFQNPRAALNPIRRIGHQIGDVLIQHNRATRSTARAKAIEILKAVKIRNPEQRYEAYPFELSGGMCQRVVIAIALACEPQLLIADEPTTGLDVTTQKAVMDLIVELARERNMATILITHDLGVATAYCDRVVVMEKGRVVEAGPATELFTRPKEDYTQRLLNATPGPESEVRDLLAPDQRTPLPEMKVFESDAPVLEVRDLVKAFGSEGKPNYHKAVAGLNFRIERGESLGLVGESGCGKSTTSAMIMRLLDTTSGSITFEGREISAIPSRKFASDPLRGKLQMVFQDPTESLNPRWSAFQSIADPLKRLAGEKNRQKIMERVGELADLVGLPQDLLDRFPHQLSGGQKARVGIARAIALNPSLLILDEPTAALDVSVQAVVLNLLEDLKRRLGMSYLFISHDLNVVRLLCDRILVMQNGQIVEQGPARALMTEPSTDYTRELLAAIPRPMPERDPTQAKEKTSA